MKVLQKPVPHAACLLADHLDSILAASEDLLAVKSEAVPGAQEDRVLLRRARAAQRRAVERIRMLECAILARLILARKRASELERADRTWRLLIRSFLSATAVVMNAVDDVCDSTRIDFHTGEGLTAYLRSRNALPVGCDTLEETAPVATTEDFLLISIMPLGTVMDLVAQVLTTLDVAFELYEPSEAEVSARDKMSGMVARDVPHTLKAWEERAAPEPMLTASELRQSFKTHLAIALEKSGDSAPAVVRLCMTPDLPIAASSNGPSHALSSADNLDSAGSRDLDRDHAQDLGCAEPLELFPSFLQRDVPREKEGVSALPFMPLSLAPEWLPKAQQRSGLDLRDTKGEAAPTPPQKSAALPKRKLSPST